MNRPALKRAAVLCGVALAASLATFVGVRAYAAGIPDPAVDGLLTYTGYLEDANGAPITDSHAIAVNFYADEKLTAPALCTGKLAATKLLGGRFQVPLPKECAAAVNDPKASPDIWVDVEVDGNSLGPTKLGAVPYALEAAHATVADNAASADALAVAPTFFSWSTVSVPSSDMETFTAEGAKTITFDVAGYYRIALNAQVIHDPTLSTVWWHLNGTATRMDNFSLEGGGKNVELISTDARHVTSTALFVKATKGQTIQINPSLTCVYTSGTYHQANFMYATEYLGPL